MTVRFSEDQIIKATGAHLASAGARASYTAVCTDTRELTQSCLFVALQGENFDAHQFLGEAAQKGASGAVVKRGKKVPSGLPRGFAHGFLALSESAEVLYKLDDFWSPPHERTVAWDDAQIGVRWPLHGDPVVSDKDRRGTPFRSAELFD